MRILIDVNLSFTWVDFLVAAGHEAVFWTSVGDAKATDHEILDWARDNGFATFTNDLDFPAIVAQRRERGPSVILLRGQPLLPEHRGEELVRVLNLHAEQLLSGAIVTLDWSDRLRIRTLPIEDKSTG